jgi:hypothetical protein
MTTYTWTDNSMQSGSACNVDIVNENLMHLKYDNVAKPAPPFVPQCVNMGRLVNGRANAITSGTGLKPRILASTVNMVGNNQSGDYLKKFVLSSDFDIPKDAPANKRSSVVLVNGSTGDPTTDASKWDYACQRRFRGNIACASVSLNNAINAISSGEQIGYTKAGAYNDSAWLSFQNGSGVPGVAYFGQQNVSKMVNKCMYTTSSVVGYNISSIKAQYSLDGANWIDIVTFNSLNTSSSAIITLNIPNYNINVNHSFRLLANSEPLGGGPYAWAITYLSIISIPFECMQTNLLSDFSNNTAVDKYNNSIQIIGNPTFSGGKFGGNGTNSGLKITTINTLGLERWCIEGRFKFTRTPAISYETLFTCNYTSCQLIRNENNKLALYVSSNNSDWNIMASQGTKSDYNTTSEYHIVVEFDGSTYKVYIDGVLDIIGVSSSKVYSLFYNLYFGIHSDEINRSLNGTIEDIRVTIGNTRYGSPSNATVGTQYFTPPASGSLVPDQYWEDTNTGKIYYGSPSSWTEVEAVFLGEVNTNSNAVIDAQTYVYNRYFNSGNLSFTTNLQTINHNLGIQNIDNVEQTVEVIEKSTGLAFNPYGYTNPLSYDNMTFYYKTDSLSSAIGIGLGINCSLYSLDSNTGYIKVILRAD